MFTSENRLQRNFISGEENGAIVIERNDLSDDGEVSWWLVEYNKYGVKIAWGGKYNHSNS